MKGSRPPSSGKSIAKVRLTGTQIASQTPIAIVPARRAGCPSSERSIGIVTALNPYIGYAAATEVATEAHLTGRGVYELVLEKGLLPKERLDAILRPETLTRPAVFVA